MPHIRQRKSGHRHHHRRAHLPAPTQLALAKAEKPSGKNVGDGERLASVFGGLALAAIGVNRFSLPGLALAAFGGALVQRGLSGKCPLYRALDAAPA